MSFFKKLFRIGKKPGTPAYRYEQAAAIHGQAIKFVTEHVDGNENIVGRGGSVSLIDGNLMIDTSGERLFSCDARVVDISWLMSGNGAIISGPNALDSDKCRSLTVHFVYYRK